MLIEKLVSARTIYSADDESVRMTYPMLMMEMKRLGKMALGSGYYNPKTTSLEPEKMQGIPFEIYSYATTVVDLEVDTITGQVDVLGVVSAHDVGTAVNPVLVEGQIEGGVAMGLGFALFELQDITRGTIKNTRFSDYMIPTALDVPKIYPVIVESVGESGPFGAKGVGEPALIPTIPAATNALENALDMRFTKLPVLYIDIMRELYKKTR